jgi:hypothetical protein
MAPKRYWSALAGVLKRPSDVLEDDVLNMTAAADLADGFVSGWNRQICGTISTYSVDVGVGDCTLNYQGEMVWE